ncbi:DUF2442 domain-containing protein [candidate division KSB1 bacterium]|nr:DUF2442 domain-containing protein [candidate division KSB1 bacterium]MBL7095575.1 DUF2442 domain-containing protein [candidate division KSB1 bacterium]
MNKIIAFKVSTKYNVWLKFSDGIEGTVDLSYLVGKGVFSLYMKITGKEPEELFPALNQEHEYA